MRKTVIASAKPVIKCKQCAKRDVHLPDLEALLKNLFDEGYSWADIHHNEYNVYKVSCEGENGIGVSAAEGEMVITDLRHKDADGFWLDDKNVKFTTPTYRQSVKESKLRAKELGIKLPRKITISSKSNFGLNKAKHYRVCPKCKEDAPYDIKHGFLEVDGEETDSPWIFKECRNCWYKETHKTRMSAKRKRINDLMKEFKVTSSDYSGEHEAPDKESGAPLFDLTQNGIFPVDLYTLPNQYVHDTFDRQCLPIISSCKGRPNKPVKVYRAVPKVLSIEEQIYQLEQQKRYILKYGKIPRDSNSKMTTSQYYDKLCSDIEALTNKPPVSAVKMTISNGDWVSINLAYARDHGKSNLNNQYKILSKLVRAKELYCDGNLSEWGFYNN